GSGLAFDGHGDSFVSRNGTSLSEQNLAERYRSRQIGQRRRRDRKDPGLRKVTRETKSGRRDGNRKSRSDGRTGGGPIRRHALGIANGARPGAAWRASHVTNGWSIQGLGIASGRGIGRQEVRERFVHY